MLTCDLFLQVAILLLLGFLIGYWLLPSFSSSPPSAVSYVKKPQMNVPLRDPAIHYSDNGDDFIVEGKKKKILSGAIHYFRVVPDYWPDRLKKLKATGLNTVET